MLLKMGRICPILNHPLQDGVFVEDKALVCFIQKRNLEFLPNELVCRSCKRDIEKIYRKKLKKAYLLYKERLNVASISTVTRSSTSTASDRSSTLNGTLKNGNIRSKNSVDTSFQQLNGSKENSVLKNHVRFNFGENNLQPTVRIASVSETAIELLTNINAHSILHENRDQKATEETNREENKEKYVTIRKKTIKDYLTVKAPTQVDNASAIQAISDIDNQGNALRLSQEPTTSKGVNSNKRRIHIVADTESDYEENLSLNAVNGTRLPHIQPIPPKRKPDQVRTSSLGHGMENYIKDITGG